ncbi:MAG: YncE family protein [Rikenellaceae bacterium]|nr:YncE family protein [Rikenellaceae bacterium]
MKTTIALLLTAALFCGCRKSEPTHTDHDIPVNGTTPHNTVHGFYLLNEGNMGSNKATLDVFDYTTRTYRRNIFPERNPNVVKELGDVGNDLKIYGGRMYAVINCSDLVEVMNAADARHIGTISVSNCRYIAFHGRYAYISSYAGPIGVDPNARPGYIAKVDTATLEIAGRCTVGYQPEEMVVTGGRLYVANSGGYRAPDYDTRVSVIDLATFTVTDEIEVAPNLHRMLLDNHGMIWASSRGDYNSPSSGIYRIDPDKRMVTATLPVATSRMTLCGDSIYLTGTEWSAITASNTKRYGIIDTRTAKLASDGFITDDTAKEIKVPYGIAVNPESREILIADAGDYLTPGTLRCYSPEGRCLWSVTTGDIPSSIAFF